MRILRGHHYFVLNPQKPCKPPENPNLQAGVCSSPPTGLPPLPEAERHVPNDGLGGGVDFGLNGVMDRLGGLGATVSASGLTGDH